MQVSLAQAAVQAGASFRDGLSSCFFQKQSLQSSSFGLHFRLSVSKYSETVIGTKPKLSSRSKVKKSCLFVPQAAVNMATKERVVELPTLEGQSDVTKAKVLVYPSAADLSKGLVEAVRVLSAAAIKERGSFTVALSGGSLVKILGKLADDEEATVDWSRWHVLWADERVVKLDHPDSNYKGAWDEFLSKVSIPKEQILAINDSVATADVAADYEKRLRTWAADSKLALAADGQFPKIDLILLGMGPDGHLASLFPNHPLLDENDRWVAPIFDSPKPPPERITLTFPVINSAANVTFVATGAGKADMLKKIFEVSLPRGDLPSQLVRPTNGNLVWMVDEPAVTNLSLL